MRRISVEDLLALLEPANVRAPARPAAEAARLGEPIALPAPWPGRPIALRAGYAVASADLIGASATSPVMLSGPLSRLRIGDPLPAGCDAVADPALVQAIGPMTVATGEVDPGEGVRRAGSDVPAAGVVLPAGTPLDPRFAALLAGISADDNASPALLVEASALAPPAAGVLAAARALVRCLAIPETIQLTVSGDPAGEKPRPGEKALSDGLALRPGDQTIVLDGPDGLRLVLPAALDALIATAAVLTAFGRVELEDGVLARKIASRVGIAEIALLRRDGEAFQVLATGDWPLWAIASATHMLLVPPASEGYPAGTAVHALPIGAWARG